MACFVLFTFRLVSLSPGKVKTENRKRKMENGKRKTCDGCAMKVKLAEVSGFGFEE